MVCCVMIGINRGRLLTWVVYLEKCKIIKIFYSDNERKDLVTANVIRKLNTVIYKIREVNRI